MSAGPGHRWYLSTERFCRPFSKLSLPLLNARTARSRYRHWRLQVRQSLYIPLGPLSPLRIIDDMVK